MYEYEIGFAERERLRALRLWHWRKAKEFETDAKRYGGSKTLMANASVHMTAVETLSVLFDTGDTAENDAAKTEKVL